MTKQEAERGIEILAKSVYRDLKQAGYARADIVAFASGILENISNDARDNAQQTDALDNAV
jgi:D-alanine-D-alanine ligase-like ATP-grasp enzyme